MRLLVTGGSGFLGRRVVLRALDQGHQVTALVRSPSAQDLMRGLGARTVHGDLNRPAAAEAAFGEATADTLISIASLGTGHAPTVVAAAEHAGIRRAVFLSTTGIFTTLDPPSKRVRTAAEATIRSSVLEWTIVRPTMIYGGPDDRNMCRLLTLLRRCPVMPLPGGGHHLQQPVHVEDLAEVVLRAAQTRAAVRRSYNIAGPEPSTFREIVATASDAVGRRVVCVPFPAGPVRALVRAHERRSSRPRLKAEQISRLLEDKCFPIDEARRDLGFAPRTFADGIRAQAQSRHGANLPPTAPPTTPAHRPATDGHAGTPVSEVLA
ncbi:NAD-dependent epimerase/dehydratase family protein [Parafrankia elaeagni]|uniref:NAD-dependent epimerase/dehydratase family protein n=1 Tax=Parafrankia elaeagni TaxID=222534 RepID=UPI00037FAF7A|nr:NAD(P)H-binding protein [Parafrankia elaeagni]